MVPKTTPETSAVIQTKLTHLREKREALDELILCLERYSVYHSPSPQGKECAMGAPARLPGRPDDVIVTRHTGF